MTDNNPNSSAVFAAIAAQKERDRVAAQQQGVGEARIPEPMPVPPSGMGEAAAPAPVGVAGSPSPASGTPPPEQGTDITEFLSPPVGDTSTEEPQQEEPGMLSKVASFLYDAAGATVPGVLALQGLGRKGDELAEAGGSKTSMDAFGFAFNDMVSYGTVDAMMSFDYGMREAMKGKNFSEAYDQRHEELAEAKAADAVEHEMAVLAGNVAGGVTGGVMLGAAGGAAIKGSQFLSKAAAPLSKSFWVRNAVVAPTIAAGEAATYRVNSAGSLEEVKWRDVGVDATMAALGTAVFAGATGLAGSTYRRVMGKDSAFYRAKVAEDLLRMQNHVNRAKGSPTGVLPQELTAMINREGPEKVILDAYPELSYYAGNVVRSQDNPQGAEKLLKLVELRNSAAIDFPTAVKDAISTRNVQGPEEFINSLKMRRVRLSERYNAVLEGGLAKGTKFKRDGITKGLDTIFEAQDANTKVKLREALALAKGALKKHATVDASGKATNELTPQSLHNARMIITKALNKKGATDKKGLNLVNDYFKEALGSMDPEYTKLTKVYGETYSQKNAFAAGHKLFTNADNSKVIDAYIDSAHSYKDIVAFTKGARARLFKEISTKADNPEAVQKYLIDNSSRLKNLEALIGKKESDALVGSVIDAVSRERTVKEMSKAIGGKTLDETHHAVNKNLADMFKATADMKLMGRRPSAITSMANLMRPGPMSQTERVAMADVVGKHVTTPLDQLPQANAELSQIASDAVPGSRMMKALAIGGGAQGAASGGTNELEALGAPPKANAAMQQSGSARVIEAIKALQQQ